jgi:taurine dioxygenase
MTTLDVRPVSGALGAEVHGVDLAALTDDLFKEIHGLLLEHLVLFFPGQSELTPQAHIAFGHRFGEVETHPFLPKAEGFPEVAVIDSADDKADIWHTDLTFSAGPPIASLLHLVTCPPYGGDTMWSNQYLAYEKLSRPMRDLLDGLTAVHVVDNPATGFRSTAEHPLVRVHPVTGRRSLYVNRAFTSHIPQLSRNESDLVLQHLFDFSEAARLTCRYHWSQGDVAVWDNRVTMHLAVNDYTARRIGQRVTVLGDLPAGDEPRWPHYEPDGDERYWPRQVNAKRGY